MKTFLVSTYNKQSAKIGTNYTLVVYRLIRNSPRIIGYCSYNTQNFKSKKSEALKVLHKHGYVSNKAMKDCEGYYEKLNLKIIIYEV